MLSLPREVAKHPTSGEPILASIGRFGPYVQHGKTYANLGNEDDVLEIGANRAIDLIIAKESGTGGSRFGRAAATPARIVGAHPEGGDILARDGKYGPYVSHNGINATLPKGKAADAVTVEEAVVLLAAKAAVGPSKKPARAAGRKAPAKTTAAAKKPAAKKPAAKKAAAPKAKAAKKT